MYRVVRRPLSEGPRGFDVALSQAVASAKSARARRHLGVSSGYTDLERFWADCIVRSHHMAGRPAVRPRFDQHGVLLPRVVGKR